MVSLTLEQILQLHALVLIRDGGSDGVRDIGRLESVVSAQHQVVFGEELYATVFTKAAALMRGIIGLRQLQRRCAVVKQSGVEKIRRLTACLGREFTEFQYILRQRKLEEILTEIGHFASFERY